MINYALVLIMVMCAVTLGIRARKTDKELNQLIDLERSRCEAVQNNYNRVFLEYKRLKVVHEVLENDFWKASQEISKIRAAYESAYHKLSYYEIEENRRGHY